MTGIFYILKQWQVTGKHFLQVYYIIVTYHWPDILYYRGFPTTRLSTANPSPPPPPSSPPFSPYPSHPHPPSSPPSSTHPPHPHPPAPNTKQIFISFPHCFNCFQVFPRFKGRVFWKMCQLISYEVRKLKKNICHRQTDTKLRQEGPACHKLIIQLFTRI